jgi:multicomponent Na+:H+ antiporter subunit D
MPISHQLAPLPVVVPLLVAALLAAVGGYLPRRLLDAIALFTTAAIFVICCLLVRDSAHGTIVYWFGNWRPDSNSHFPVGICFAIDPIGAGLAAMVALLSLASFTFSWAYFQQIKSLYHALMLVFVAAMCGLCLTGDLFNLFVWFELMTAAAVALCGYKSEESWPLLGALNFAVVNTVGAFLSLGGIALLYAYTGSLNMAEVSRSLVSHPPGATFVLIAFAFVCAGFLVKMAVVPFQFWLADAHAVAPTPVCVLFSGVMVELGLYAIARLYWLVFSPSLNAAARHAVPDLFLFIGSITAVLGAIYCFGQRHLKRLLAFSTISHVGLMVVGFALLTPAALGGTSIYLVGHGCAKGALFLGAGILLHRCGSVDEYDLRGKGHILKPLAILFAGSALALAGVPPFATFYGEAEIRNAAEQLHIGWLSPVTMIAEGLTAAAILRFTARAFFGSGATQEATSRGSPHIRMDTETASGHSKTPISMWLPATFLLVIAATIATLPGFRAETITAAHHFQKPLEITAITLDAAPDQFQTTHPAPPAHFRVENVVTLSVAVLLAAIPLFPRVLSKRLNWMIATRLISLMRPLRKVQSGNVGDYVAWFVLGIATYAAILTLLLR